MVSSLLIKLGMFAVTLGVVFWIGWTLPNSFDRPNDLGAQSLEESKVAPAAAPKRSHQTLLDLNRATEQEFDALPGIGARLAERIIAYRQSVGTFRTLDELQQVKGIGMKKFERIRPLITVVPDSESVSRERKGT